VTRKEQMRLFFSGLLKTPSINAYDVQVCTGDLSRADRFGKAA